MDLNQLFFRHQVSLMRAAAARSSKALAAHRKEAADYAGRICDLRAVMGATTIMALPAASTGAFAVSRRIYS